MKRNSGRFVVASRPEFHAGFHRPRPPRRVKRSAVGSTPQRAGSFILALFILAGLSRSLAATAAEPDERTRAEIAYLFSHLRASGCEFYRNGSWYPATRAVEHLNKKYEYLAKRKLISTTESFIERAAAQSSVSRKPYQVRCGEEPPVNSGQWFIEALSRYRAAPR